MNKLENFFGSLVGKVSNIFISFFIRFFIHRQYKGFSSATSDFDSMEKSTPNFK